jgi:hypothetical protein
MPDYYHSGNTGLPNNLVIWPRGIRKKHRRRLVRKMLAYPFVHMNGQWCRWKGVPPYDESLSKYALHAEPVSQGEETYQEMCDPRKASAIFQVPMADDGTQQWFLQGRFIRAAFQSHLPPQWLIEAGTCRRLATRDPSDLDLSDMSDLDPQFLLANTIDAYAKAAVTGRLSVPGFDRATFQCQDSMLAGVTADFIKGVGEIHIRLRSLAEDHGCFDATKEKILCNLLAERSMPRSSRSRTVADYMHSDERDHRTSCAYGSEILIAQPDLMDEVLSQVSAIILTAHTRPDWSASERLKASIGEGLGDHTVHRREIPGRKPLRWGSV